MNTIRKMLAMLLAATSVFAFAACGGGGDGDSSPDSSSSGGGEKEVAKYLTEKADSAGRLTLDKTSDCPADFVLQVDGSEPIKILQLTDTQMTDNTQVRKGNGAVSSAYSDHDHTVYDIVRQTVEETKPDLILLTGDYVVGDYDDNGSLFREQTDFFDSLGIYWAPIFGNHDNDCDLELGIELGIWVDEGWPDWYPRLQCRYFEKAEYCLFRTRAEISGYSNFSIAIEQGGEVVRSVIMMDTKGSKSTAMEITPKQMSWYKQTVDAIDAYAGKDVPHFVGIHVPMAVFEKAMVEKYGAYGYDATLTTYEIPADNADGDFGRLGGQGLSYSYDKDYSQFNTFKNNGTDAILAGHIHKVNTVVDYQGVKLVMGTKSSRYDKYNEDMLGGTLFTVTGGAFTVEHYYYTEQTTEE